MKNVLFLAHNLNPSDGWGCVTSHLSNLMTARGYRIQYETCSLKRSGPLPNINQPIFYTISFSIGSLKSVLRDILNSILNLKRYQCCDLIVAADETVLFSAFCRSLVSRAKYVCIFHGTYGPLLLNSKLSFLFRISAFYAHHLFFVSEYTRLKVFPSLYPKRYNFSTLPLGVSPSDYSPLAACSRKNQILTVGEVKPRKGIEQTILALTIIPPFKRPVYLIAGKYSEHSSYYKRLRSLIKDNLLDDYVKFLGTVSRNDLVQLYRFSRIFVLPSQVIDNHFEGFGLVHLEAQSYGTPAIGSTQSGNSEVINHGNDGFLLNNNSTLELSEYISDLLYDDVLWSRLSLNAYNRSLSRSWDKTLDSLLECLKQA